MTIIANAVLKQKSTLSRGFIEEVTLENKTKQELVNLGFEIKSSSIICVSIEADISLFERVFNTKISKRNKAKGEFADTYHFESKPTIPDNLAGISDIVFTPAIILFDKGL